MYDDEQRYNGLQVNLPHIEHAVLDAPSPMGPTLTARDSPLLDADAFPHILDRIADLADLPSSLRLRATCRRLRDRIEKRLFQHVLFWVEGYGVKGYASSSDGYRARLPMAPLTTSPHPAVSWGPYDPDPMVRDDLDRHRLDRLGIPGPVPNFNAVVKHTRTLDVMTGGLEPTMLPALSSGTLVRTASLCPLLPPSETEVRYLDTRSHKDHLHLRFLGPQRWTIHITFDSQWPTLPGGLIGISEASEDTEDDSRFITLVLHPIPSGHAMLWDEESLGLEAFLPSPRPRSPPIISSVTVVGLETCPVELMGFLPQAKTDDVRAEFERICQSHYPISFVTMEEWAATANPREVEVPEHMVEAIKNVGLKPEEKYRPWDDPTFLLEVMDE
jgi:hypothetical protein